VGGVCLSEVGSTGEHLVISSPSASAPTTGSKSSSPGWTTPR
jgi:hypothetical protein